MALHFHGDEDVKLDITLYKIIKNNLYHVNMHIVLWLGV